jgi:uncharacterized protein (DUF362 family)
MSEVKQSAVILRSVLGRPVTDVVRECMERCGWESLVPHNATVVLKPNLSAAAPDKVGASNTDVAVVEAVCRVLLDRTRRIVIGESGHLRQTPWEAFRSSGYVQMAQNLGIELINFSESPTVPVRLDSGIEIPMPRPLMDAEVYINLPKLKTHALTYFTGALKNQWGCVPDCRDRLRHHRKVHAMLSSLQRLLQPKLILMDGIIGMEGRGPVNGQPRRLDVLLASGDPVALDSTAMRLVGLDPQRARHVMLAAQQGLGNWAQADIVVDGDWDRLTTTFVPPPRDFANSAMFYAAQYPWFVKHVLTNDTIYYPIRNMVQFMRSLKLVPR